MRADDRPSLPRKTKTHEKHRLCVAVEHTIPSSRHDQRLSTNTPLPMHGRGMVDGLSRPPPPHDTLPSLPRWRSTEICRRCLKFRMCSQFSRSRRHGDRSTCMQLGASCVSRPLQGTHTVMFTHFAVSPVNSSHSHGVFFFEVCFLVRL